MTQYRKKPVTIEAVQFDGLNPAEIKDFVGENCEVEIYDNEVTPPVARIVIHTLEGDMGVSKGDYVIKGVKGEFYPCKPDIFQQTYESVETQKELEEEIRKYLSDRWKFGCCTPVTPVVLPNYTTVDLKKCANHFAQWQKNQIPMPEDTVLFQKGVAEGRRLEREDMLKDAVEKIVGQLERQWGGNIHFMHGFEVDEMDFPFLNSQECGYGDKVRIVVLKAEEDLK